MQICRHRGKKSLRLTSSIFKILKDNVMFEKFSTLKFLFTSTYLFMLSKKPVLTCKDLLCYVAMWLLSLSEYRIVKYK